MSFTKINSYSSKMILTISMILCFIPFDTKRKSLMILNKIYAIINILTLTYFTTKYYRTVNVPAIFLMAQTVLKPSKTAILAEKIRSVEKNHGAKFTGFISIAIMLLIYLILHRFTDNYTPQGVFYGRIAYCFLSFANSFVVLAHKKHFEMSNGRIKARGFRRENDALEAVLRARKEYKKNVDDLGNYNEIFGMYFLIATTALVIVGASTLHRFTLTDYDGKFAIVEKDVPFLAIAVLGTFFGIFCCDSTVNEGKKLKGICFDILDGPLDNRCSEESYHRVLELIDFIDKYPPLFTSNGFICINRSTILSIINNVMTYLIVVFTW